MPLRSPDAAIPPAQTPGFGTLTPLLPGLDELWQETQGHPNVRIAVLDGPVDSAHPCFSGHRIVHSAPRAGSDAPWLALLSTRVPGKTPSHHGTHVASLLFARHGCGVQGMAPGCSGAVLPVFEQTAGGSVIPCSQIDLARAIGQAVDAGAHIVNISGGELSASGKANEFLRKAVQQAVDANVLIVSAVGNDGCECLHVPAVLPGVLAVGALDPQSRPLDSSNWAESLARQGLMAPGYRLLGAVPGGGIDTMTGSSFATPLVSGAAALLLSLQLMRGEKPDPQAVRQALLQSAAPCDQQQVSDCRRLLGGRLEIGAARRFLGLGHSVAPQALPATSTSSFYLSHSPSALRPSGGLRPSGFQANLQEPGSRTFSCEGGQDLVFVLGELGYDFGCEARLDYFVQRMGSLSAAMSPSRMATNLQKEDANALVWTLNIDATPTFAILPDDQFAARSYDLLINFLSDQYLDSAQDTKGQERLYRVALAGRIEGTTSLYNGTIVPVLRPVTRGMFNWDSEVLLDAIVGTQPWAEDQQEEVVAIQDFLRHIYYELRNLGQTSQERALNFAGTNAYNSGEVFRDAWSKGLHGLEHFDVVPSPICRPDSDCWDVKMTFFDPKNPYKKARRVYRYTIDVSDVMPVTVGPVRSWPVYTNPKS